MPNAMLKAAYNTDSTKKKNNLVDLIKCELSDLKDEIEKMSEVEKEIERTDKIVDIVEKILEFNNQNQERQGLKIVTPDQNA